jgi:hypothetical protein
MAAESAITGLADRASQELRLAWRKLYRAGPSLGLSRDLIIDALANKIRDGAVACKPLRVSIHLLAMSWQWYEHSSYRE